MIFLVSSMAYMSRAGLSVPDIGLYVGFTRLTPLFFVWVGLKLDHLVPPAKLNIICETLCGVLTLGMFYVWTGGVSLFPAFVFLSAIRSTVAFFQNASRVRILKVLDERANSSESRSAVWLNKVTHGTSLFAAGFAILFVQFFTYEQVILLDAASYFLNILLFATVAWNMSAVKRDDSNLQERLLGPLQYFKKMFPFSLFDILLALVMMGANLFSVRIARGSEHLMISFLASYGLAVWISGFAIRKKWIADRYYWSAPILGICYFVLAKTELPPVIAWTVYLIADSAYWLLFHHISVAIQEKSTSEEVGAINLWRNTLMVGILAAGEFIVGGWAEIVPLPVEGWLRLALSIAVLCSLLKFRQTRVTSQ